MSSPADPPPPDDGAWTVQLEPGAPPPVPAPAPGSHRRLALGLVAALVVGAAVLWGPRPAPEAPQPVATVLGGHLAAPISLPLPAGAVSTADGSYVGVRFADAGVVLVTVPTEVVDPSGDRIPLPADPATWLARHPGIFVSRVRTVTVGGTPAIQVDYRRSRAGAPPSRFARLPLFCGWRGEGTSSPVCTQITADARIRATFVPVGARTVLVEAVWRPAEGAPTRIPTTLRHAYTSLLSTLTPAVLPRST